MVNISALQAVGRLPPSVQRQLHRVEPCFCVIDYGICIWNIWGCRRMRDPQTHGFRIIWGYHHFRKLSCHQSIVLNIYIYTYIYMAIVRIPNFMV
jgi:hypothetical protein